LVPTNGSRRGHKPSRRGALELLAGSPDGCTEAILLAHGITVALMVSWCAPDLRRHRPSASWQGGLKLEVARVRITEAERRALADAGGRWAMTPVFTIHGRGTVRLTICLGPWALKLAGNARGTSLQSF
jgi:hypothetical protein